MKNKNINQNQIDRFEKKWLISNTTKDTICVAFYRSNFFFRDIHETRQVNTIYYDDSKLSSLRENIDGTYDKTKYRLRWYGDRETIKNPQFEIKIKKGYVTKKKVFKLNIESPILFSQKNSEVLIENIKNKVVKLNKSLYPILSTHYYRDYFLSSNNKIRATLDYNFRNSILYGYQNINFLKNNQNFIIEMKYSRDYDSFVKKNIAFISSRLSKSSKYFISALENSKIYGL